MRRIRMGTRLVGGGRSSSAPAALAVLLACAVVAAACVSAGAANSAPPPGTAILPGPSGLAGAPYSCGGLPLDPAAPALQTGAEEGSDGPALALRQAIDRLSILPRSGWLRVSASDTDVLFVAAGSKAFAPFVFVDARAEDSLWVAYAYGDCELLAANADFEPYSFWQAGSVDATGRVIDVRLTIGGCFPPVAGPTVWYDPSSVVVTFWARRPAQPSGVVCPLWIAYQPWTLTLAEPLGDRQLLEGPAAKAQPAPTLPAS
jgi:hypothetical protein